MFHSHSDFQLHIIYNQLISSLSLEDATRRKSFYVFGSPKTYKTLLLNVCCEAFILLGRSPKYSLRIHLILNMLTAWFEVTYNHGREISIDEATVPFKGRSSMKQYLPMNPVKRGFQVCMQQIEIEGIYPG